MTKPESVLVKARAVVRHLGHGEADGHREYADWHINIKMGASYVSVWHSGAMVFLSLAGAPVYHRPGPWEQYLERLFQKVPGG